MASCLSLGKTRFFGPNTSLRDILDDHSFLDLLDRFRFRQIGLKRGAMGVGIGIEMMEFE
jgi:hypothetical protein